MTFDTAKILYQEQLQNPADAVEWKQRVTLSEHTYNILQNDIDTFRIVPRRGTGKAMHYAVNLIFQRYWDSAKASIAMSLQKKQIEWEHVLEHVHPEQARASAIQALSNHYQSELLSCIKESRRESGHTFTITLDKESKQILASDTCQQERIFYQNRVGRYINAILKEYASLPYVERERVYYRKICNMIKLAVNAQNRLLHLTLHSAYSGQRENTVSLSSVGLWTDSENLYHYLAGLVPVGFGMGWISQSIRLSSIKSCDLLEQTAMINYKYKQDILTAIRKKGIQYLSAEYSNQKICVQLTCNGEKLYQRLLHLRPTYIEKSDDHIYIFDCTEFQAETYFFKFGPDAKILSPQKLAKKFEKR